MFKHVRYRFRDHWHSALTCTRRNLDSIVHRSISPLAERVVCGVFLGQKGGQTKMTELLLVLGAIAPLTFAALFGIGALMGVVRVIAQLLSRHAWFRQPAPPRAGVQVDAQNVRARAALLDRRPAVPHGMFQAN